MATAWGDESVRKTGVPSPMYLMGACVCDDTETETRQRLALLKPKGARKLHWRDMRPSLRGKVVDAMAAMDIDHVIVAAVPMSQWNTAERARRKCLERLLPLLETEYNVDTLVLERREISQDRNDIRFIDGLRSRRFIGPIRVELCAGETDARLWLPDQLLGAYHMNREEQVRILIDYLKKENTGYASLADPVDYTGRRRLLRSLMNVRWPGEADPEYTRIQDELLKEEAEQKGIVEWGQLPTIGGQFPCETIKNVDKISL